VLISLPVGPLLVDGVQGYSRSTRHGGRQFGCRHDSSRLMRRGQNLMLVVDAATQRRSTGGRPLLPARPSSYRRRSLSRAAVERNGAGFAHDATLFGGASCTPRAFAVGGQHITIGISCRGVVAFSGCRADIKTLYGFRAETGGSDAREASCPCLLGSDDHDAPPYRLALPSIVNHRRGHRSR